MYIFGVLKNIITKSRVLMAEAEMELALLEARVLAHLPSGQAPGPASRPAVLRRPLEQTWPHPSRVGRSLSLSPSALVPTDLGEEDQRQHQDADLPGPAAARALRDPPAVSGLT